MRFSVDAWDPSYGTSVAGDDLADSSARVEVNLEVRAAAWRPMAVPSARARSVTAPSAVLFVDGVRRVEARAWIHDLAPDGGQATAAAPAICASYACGVVCCCGQGAHLLGAHVRRGLFTAASHAVDLATGGGRYRVRTAKDGPDGPTLALQQELLELEVRIAAKARGAHELVQTIDDDDRPFADVLAGEFGEGFGGRPGQHTADRSAGQADDLLVVDGPLRGRTRLPRTLGFVKTHHTQYLPAAQHAVVGALGRAERTPIFLLNNRRDASWDRFTWYLRLPSRPGAPWAGVARVECRADLPLDEAVALADLSQAVLPRFASQEFKDGRAPQNLYPIAGLERALRRRLGDAQLLYRSLRRAAAG
ncbi:hypothetical protein [Pseudofrankia sp. BMG5.36]|uniref:hypothetical protein n=2 Tax=unclassified Pseudofrankia TaxID=2994372 RepID=UPI0008D9CC4C|nr:hypothetical protein BCD48_09515 [Pseudofrankia sp. BMG5.36]